jgi:hypothetical protein
MMREARRASLFVVVICGVLALGQFLPWAYRLVISPAPGTLTVWGAMGYIEQGRGALIKCQPALYARVKHMPLSDGVYLAADELGVTYTRPGHPVSDLMPRLAAAACAQQTVFTP